MNVLDKFALHMLRALKLSAVRALEDAKIEFVLMGYRRGLNFTDIIIGHDWISHYPPI